MLELRLCLEPQLASLIVMRASAADLAHMKAIVKEGERLKDWLSAERSDVAFHASLFAATHNSALMHIWEMIAETRRQSTWLNLKQSSFSMARWKVYQGQHQTIADKVVARDAKGLNQALMDHLLLAQGRML